MEEKLTELYKATEEMRKWQEKWQETKDVKAYYKKKHYENYVDRLLLDINELEHG
jgi:hypothetical protein